MFAEIWKQALKDKNPALYRQLAAEGRLEEEAEQVEEERLEELSQIQWAAVDMAAEETDDYMERVQMINAARSQAIEVIIAQITDLPTEG